ncbi:MAG: hypothetical protein WDN44_15950 [Sphingomonas sp.]
MTNDKTARAAMAAIYGRASRELAASADRITTPAIAELTEAEIAQVSGGLELSRRIRS